MIDLSYKPKAEPESIQPEEVVCAIIAVLLWITITVLFVRAL